jgi:hypothetical protein
MFIELLKQVIRVMFPRVKIKMEDIYRPQHNKKHKATASHINIKTE